MAILWPNDEHSRLRSGDVLRHRSHNPLRGKTALSQQNAPTPQQAQSLRQRAKGSATGDNDRRSKNTAVPQLRVCAMYTTDRIPEKMEENFSVLWNFATLRFF